MAWTTPKTWTAGALTVADMQAQVSDNATWLKDALATIGQSSDSVVGQLKSAVYGASVHRSSTQSIPNVTNTSVTFPSEYTDSDNFHSTVSNTTRITIPTNGGGLYLVGYTAEFAANNTGDRWASLAVNGTNVEWGGDRRPAVSGGSSATRLSTAAAWVGATATDYLTLVVFQNSGGNLGLTYANLWAMRLFAS